MDAAVLEQIIKHAIEQVPALALFTMLAWMFLKTLTHRDTLFVAAMKDVKEEMKALTQVMTELARNMHHSQEDTCKFHKEFEDVLDRILKAVTRHGEKQ
jgi:hypothetical protein